MVATPIRLADGARVVPEAPGLGVSVDERAAAKRLFRHEPMFAARAVHRDGGIVDW